MPDTDERAENKKGEQVANETFMTVIHEVGHAITAVALGFDHSTIKIKMNDRYKEKDFAKRNEIYVHGQNKPDENSTSRYSTDRLKMMLASSGYAGLLTELLFVPAFENSNANELWDVLHSPLVKMSKEDEGQIALAGTRKREAFDAALAIVRPNVKLIRSVSIHVTQDFLKDPSDLLHYTIDSVSDKAPAKESIKF